MKILKIARKKLAEKSVSWEECYTPDTAYFKAMYDDILGKGSYFRFEGKDSETGDWHMVIVGPAKMHEPESKFFAGQRKLPSTYSASGEYFSDLKEALNHAATNWGVTMPPEANLGLTSSDLKGLGNKADSWREDNSKDDVLSKFKKQVTDPKNNPRSASSDGLNKFAMGAVPFYNRPKSRYFDIDQLDRGYPEDWDQVVESWPDVVAELEYARGYRNDLRERLIARYGDQGETLLQMHKFYLAINPEQDSKGRPFGSHLVSIGPYVGKKFRYAVNKFGTFTRKLTVYTPEEMASAIAEQINHYNEMYGVQLHPQNFNTPEAIANRYLQQLITVNADGKDAIDRSLADRFDIDSGAKGWKERISESIETQQREWLAAQNPNINVQTANRKDIDNHIKLAWKSYEEARQRGQNVPKPPMLDIRVNNNDRKTEGAQKFSAIVKFPAFKVVGAIQSGTNTITVESSVPNHSLKRIGRGSVIKLSTYDSAGAWVHGKRTFVVDSFVVEGQRAIITTREPIQVDIPLPRTDNEWFRNYLINVERRVDEVGGRSIDWSMKDHQIAAQTGEDIARIKELRQACDAIFYGFDDLQTTLDVSEMSNKGRPQGQERIIAEHNYTSEDLNRYATLRAEQLSQPQPQEQERPVDQTVQGVGGVQGVGAAPSQGNTDGKNQPTETPEGIESEKTPTTAPVAPAPAKEKKRKPKSIFDLEEEVVESSTVKGIVALAKDLDASGKGKAADDIRNILRKHL